MIDLEFSHNPILGKPWIHMIKAVPSSYHQLLQDPTLTEIADIRGDQAMSRTISAIARKKLSWVPKVAKTATDGDSPAGKNQKQITDQ